MVRISITVLAAVAAIALTATAFAAKPAPPLIDVDCGADGTFTIIGGPGQGRWTPGIIADGSGVLIPVAFSNQHGTFTDNEGHVFSDDPPDISKHAPANKDLMDCHFSVSFEDENGSGSFSGDAVVFLVPPRR